MRYPTAMIFPATVPRAELCLPLLLMCDRIAWCRTMEDGDAAAEAGGVDHFTKLPFCQAWIPVPLGERHAAFAALVRDLRSQRGDFAARFSRLAMAGMGEAAQGAAESSSDILGQVRGQEWCRGHCIRRQRGAGGRVVAGAAGA